LLQLSNLLLELSLFCVAAHDVGGHGGGGVGGSEGGGDGRNNLLQSFGQFE
jgi:hypothetical protein